MQVRYIQRRDELLGGWAIEGIYANSGVEFDGNSGGLTLGDVDSLFDAADKRQFGETYRIIIGGTPNIDSGDTRSGCDDGPPIYQSYAIFPEDVNLAFASAETYYSGEENWYDIPAEEFASALTSVGGTYWCRVDSITIVKSTGGR